MVEASHSRQNIDAQERVVAQGIGSPEVPGIRTTEGEVANDSLAKQERASRSIARSRSVQVISSQSAVFPKSRHHRLALSVYPGRDPCRIPPEVNARVGGCILFFWRSIVKSPNGLAIEQRKTNLAVMTAIGSLVFCNDCGNLLPASKGSEKNRLQCECCGQESKGLRASI